MHASGLSHRANSSLPLQPMVKERVWVHPKAAGRTGVSKPSARGLFSLADENERNQGLGSEGGRLGDGRGARPCR